MSEKKKLKRTLTCVINIAMTTLILFGHDRLSMSPTGGYAIEKYDANGIAYLRMIYNDSDSIPKLAKYIALDATEITIDPIPNIKAVIFNDQISIDTFLLNHFIYPLYDSGQFAPIIGLLITQQGDIAETRLIRSSSYSEIDSMVLSFGSLIKPQSPAYSNNKAVNSFKYLIFEIGGGNGVSIRER